VRCIGQVWHNLPRNVKTCRIAATSGAVKYGKLQQVAPKQLPPDEQARRDELARRIRTARAYANLTSVEALAEAISEDGLGVRTLRGIEQGKRPARKRELAAIAEACGLPATFFTDEDPFAKPGDEDRIAQEIQANRDVLMTAVQQGHDERQVIMALLKQQEAILRELTRVVQGLPSDENLQALNDAVRRLEDLG
jgi:transcriptional regulator with XRE-family HTH domain